MSNFVDMKTNNNKKSNVIIHRARPLIGPKAGFNGKKTIRKYGGKTNN